MYLHVNFANMIIFGAKMNTRYLDILGTLQKCRDIRMSI